MAYSCGGDETKAVMKPERDIDSRPRGVLFHWVGNIFFASLALFGGVLFGERIPRERFGLVAVIIALVALLLVPITRSWERSGIEKRRREREASKNKVSEQPSPAHEGEGPPIT